LKLMWTPSSGDFSKTEVRGMRFVERSLPARPRELGLGANKGEKILSALASLSLVAGKINSRSSGQRWQKVQGVTYAQLRNQLTRVPIIHIILSIRAVFFGLEKGAQDNDTSKICYVQEVGGD
jgi:hypothetical protein